MTARQAFQILLANGEITQSDYDRLVARLSPEPAPIASVPTTIPESPAAKPSFFTWITMGVKAVIGMIGFVKPGGGKSTAAIDEDTQRRENTTPK